MSRGLWYAMGARTRRSLTVLWLALFLCSIGMQYVQMATPTAALAAHNEGIFELDGNALDSGAAGADWENGAEGSLDQFFVGMASEAAANDTTYFQTGGSKDENAISAWKRTSVAGSPDKNEILDAYAAVFEDGGETWVYFGADRFDNDGDAQIGFWFFQDEIGLNGADFTGEHEVGDVLILSEYTNGGVVDLICAYEWNPPGGGSIANPGDCDPPTSGSNLDLVAAGAACDIADGTYDICAVTNTASSDAPWTFLNKDGSSDFGPGQFFEGGINLSDMFGGEPPCFGTFLAETRSSQETDAQLKDFALGSLNTCVPPDIETQVQQDGQDVSKINMGESVVDVATFDGDNGTVEGTVEFFVCGPTQSAQGCDNGGTKVGATKTISNETATSDSFTPTALGTYCFRAEYTAADGSEYLDGSHTNATTECFRVIPADVQIVKTPNDGSANAGESISFSLSWTNEGEGKATGVVVTDDLPAGAGLDWSITGSTGTGSTCAIAGAVGSEVLTCTIGTIDGNPNFPNDAPVNGTVTVTSATTAADCGAIDNLGEITSSNDGTDTNAGKITVLCPDVKVTKTPDGGSANAGDTITWSIKVENIGAGTATGVTLTDNLPAGVDWSESEADCTITGAVGSEVLDCTVGTLVAGASKTYTVSGTAGADDCGPINNTASATATNEPSNVLANNSDAGDVTVLCAQIDIEKDANPAGPVSAGDQIGFDIVVSNNGTGFATGVSVADDLPGTAGLDWSIASTTGDTVGVSCSISGALGSEVLTCTDANMAAGDSFTVRVVSGTASASCTTINNTASVTTLNDGQDSDNASVQVLCPDVTVLKTADNSPINAGDTAAYTITVSNAGPGVAKGVTLSDPLPAGISWTEDSAACSIAANTLTCSFGDLAAGQSAVVHVSGLTDAADCKTLPNTATVAATNEAVAQQGNNTSTANIVVECPNITVVKSGNGPINAGDTATFTITLSNAGPGDAYGVTLNDQLPAGDWTLGGADGASCSIVANLVTCDFGTVLAGDDRVITVSKTSDATDCDAIPNTVTVAATNEPAGTNGNTSQATIVVNCPDLEIVKDGNGPISAGEDAVFTITVTNHGPGVAYDVELDDDLPTGIAWVLSGPNAGLCSIDEAVEPDHLNCQFGTLQVDASRSITLTGATDANDCGSIPNTATTEASNEDTENDQYPNSDSATIVVNCPTILITKTAIDPVINAGDPIGFEIIAKNNGDGSAFNVVVTDDLPDGIDWAEDSDVCSIVPDSGTVGQVMTCTVGTLTAAGTEGDTFTVHVTGVTDAGDCPSVSNQAVMTYTGGSETPSNTANVTVNCSDVSVIKSGNGPIGNGDTATFTITVTNHGPGDAYDVDLTDQLPAGAWTLGGDDAADCDISATNLLTCEFGTIEAPGLESDDSRTITVSRTATTADCGTIPNDVTVGASNEDPSKLANNTDDATITVTCSFGLLIDKTNDAPLETLELPDGTLLDLPTADEGDTVTYTLDYDLVADPVTNGIITDVLPVGVTYVDGSAEGDAQFTFQGYDEATRTLTWTAADVSEDGSVSYQVTVDVGASELLQPLLNVAAIDSVETEPDDGDAEVYVPTIPEAATATPKITLPPTDALATPQTQSNPGFSLMLILLALAALVLVIGFVTPVPASVRERSRR